MFKFILIDLLKMLRTENGVVPSTPHQLEFEKILSVEMQSLGLSDFQISKYGYVYGFLAATKGKENNML